MGACDDADAPWLAPTRSLIADAVARGVPTLGVCLGHQLAAVALGGRVDRNPSGRTVGLVPVRLTDAGALRPAAVRPRRPVAVHYNDDVVHEAPAGPVLLATLPDGRPQALRFGPAAWGVQFHPETSPEVFGAWLRWDSPDGLTPEQEELLGEVTAATEALRAAWQPLARAVRDAACSRTSARPCVVRHVLSPPLPHRRSIDAAGPAPVVDPATENAMSPPTPAESRERVVILGAAGRDFHDFNLMYRDDPGVEVVAFTATQIPDIDGRTYPPELAGPLYPRRHPDPRRVRARGARRARARRHGPARLLRPLARPGHAPRPRGSIATGADFVVPG